MNAVTSLASPQPLTARASTARIVSIDALRGLVILLMLVDHTREFFFLHAQVSDPMALPGTPPDLFFTRLLAHLCAPVFVALTGLAAFLFGAARGPAATADFLLKRGAFLILLEVSVVNFAWTFSLSPQTIFLQVIWAIGWSMIALAALVHLPRLAIAAVGAAIVTGHNLLDPIGFAPDQPGHAIWAILHDRGFIDLPGDLRARTSYPVLPWIGVIALGYAIGPWFAASVLPLRRRALLVGAGVALLLAFAALRLANGYGDPGAWQPGATPLATTMSVLNLTKYPPSLGFLLLTLGTGALLLAALEPLPGRAVGWLAVFGGAPLFFYVLHLYALHALNRLAAASSGAGDTLVSVPGVGALWLLAALVALPCWFACRWFGGVKRRSTRWWLRYL